VRPPRSEFNAMPVLYLIGGVVSLSLLVYLFIALLKPEAFS
jgi:K+-transporting ATPase KdpF subunit